MIPGTKRLRGFDREIEIDPDTGREGDVLRIPFTFFGAVQPVPGEVVDRLDLGHRTSDMKAIWTYSKRLKASNPKFGEFASLVEFDDGHGTDTWEVNTIENWGLLPHFMVIVVRHKEEG